MELKRNYEISIWEQKGQQEIKIGTIGSNDMTSPGRAQNPLLTRNTNGTKKLDFYLFYEYVDEIEGKIKRNPYCSLLSNGRKIKLKWKNKWYEFIITNIIEDSENKKITYTAQDAYIIELSRKGFNIELSTDLENNQGTITQLTNYILKNTDWTLDEENSLISPQTIDEILVELETTSIIKTTQKTFLDSNGILTIEKVNLDIPIGSKIYSFYSLINNKDSFFQFYYLEDKDEYRFNEEGFIYDCPLYIIENYKYENDTPIKMKKIQVVNNKGKKLIRSQKTEYNSVLDTYVKYYKADEDEIIGYTKTEYFTDNFVSNLITNDKDFITDVGWYNISNNTDFTRLTQIKVYNYPEAEVALELLQDNSEIETKSYLQVNTNVLNNWIFYNSGPNDNKEILNSLFNGKKFVVRLKYGYNKNLVVSTQLKSAPYDKATKKMKTGFTVDLCMYDFDEEGQPTNLHILATTKLSGEEENVFQKDGEYWTAICQCYENYSKEELKDKNLGLFFKYCDTEDLRLKENDLEKCFFYLEDCQFFELKVKNQEDNQYYIPGEIIESEAKIRYNYFSRTENLEKDEKGNQVLKFDSEEQIKFIYQGYSPKEYEKEYYNNFPQIKTVEGKESNIFNLIQTLCEKFECWADFLVEHDELGYIKKDTTGKPIKKICYRPYLGKENWSGFRRGINLKNVTRNLDSTQITTKTIVKPNSNEFAPNGFCTIAYSKENPSGENFIYDFSHYISKGLIDSYQMHERLYGTNGLYKKLKTINEENQKIIDNRVAVSNSLLYNEKEKEIYSALISELSSSIAEAKKEFRLYSSMSYQTFLTQPEAIKQNILKLSGVNGAFVKIVSQLSQIKSARKKLEEINLNYEKDFKQYKSLIKQITKNSNEKEKLILEFESEYSSFIQEGVWISEEQIDHDLYYIEAKNIATTSSIPKISYNINVIDISSLEEFFNYEVDIGDKTYIIDPEFFGYLNEFAIKTPKKQEVIITELIEDLERPENNKTTVQSYKTQFDDLFQRITATSQQLQLNEGAYNRAAGAFSNYGLDTTYTQNSLNNSNFLLQNNTIKWNVDGFVSTNSLNKHQFLKIHNGSIYLTDDGGATWNAAINGKGINANYIYAGQLDAGKINIVSELKVTENQELQYCLTMDQNGLSMYSFEDGTKMTRVRLGKIAFEEDEEAEENLYGLQLYNNQGVQTFKTDSNGDITMTGTIYAKDGYFKGAVVASRGHIGGWIIEENQLYHQVGNEIDAIIATEDLAENYMVNGRITNDWRLIFGLKNNIGNFGVTADGNLYANGVDIKDGNISFGDLFKITSNGGADRAVNYGLSIDLSPENADESVVIESEERVIGIREKKKDTLGNVVLDSNGKPSWTWKTIIGDLTNVTLGTGENAQKMSDLDINGYGICTDNGFFSGYVVAGAGQIGGFVITQNSLYSNNEFNIKNKEKEDLSEKNAIGVYLDGINGYIAFRNPNEEDYLQFNSDGLSIKASEIITNNSTITIRDGFTITDNGIYISKKEDVDNFINEINEIGMKITKDKEVVFEITKEKIKGENGNFSRSLTVDNYIFSSFSQDDKKRIGCFLR